MIQLDPTSRGFIVCADEPITVDVDLGNDSGGPAISHVYRGMDPTPEDEPIGGYDTSVPNQMWIYGETDYVSRQEKRPDGIYRAITVSLTKEAVSVDEETGSIVYPLTFDEASALGLDGTLRTPLPIEVVETITRGSHPAYFEGLTGGKTPPDVLGPWVGHEAHCDRCDETFNPTSEDITPSGMAVHYNRADGTECGGFGEVKGSWG